jgi:hypothetical protein
MPALALCATVIIWATALSAIRDWTDARGGRGQRGGYIDGLHRG